MEFGIVYSKNTGRIRSIVIPEENEQHILDLVNLNNGEAFIRFDMEDFDNEEVLQEKLNKITGITPKDDRYVVVDNDGKIESIIIADEKCGDKIKGKQMIKHAEATMNWTFNKNTKEFNAPEKENG